MTAEDQNITIEERESKIIDPSPLTEEHDDSIVDLVDGDFKWIVHRKGTVEVEKTVGNGIEITDAGSGHWEIHLDPVDTEGLGGKRYRHEARFTDAQDNESVVVKGRFTIEESET